MVSTSDGFKFKRNRLKLTITQNQVTNIAGRLPENNHNNWVDLQSKKTVKKTDQKIHLFMKADILYFDRNSV